MNVPVQARGDMRVGSREASTESRNSPVLVYAPLVPVKRARWNAALSAIDTVMLFVRIAPGFLM